MSFALAADLLAELERRRGAKFAVRDGALVVCPPEVLEPEDLTRVRALERELTRVVEIRTYTLMAFRLLTAGHEADPDLCKQISQELQRLLDEVGPGIARRLQKKWAHEYALDTGVCPHCGSSSEIHVSDGA